MDQHPQDRLTTALEALVAEEARLETELRETEAKYSGLTDIDLTLSLSRSKLEQCLLIIGRIPREQDQHARAGLKAQVTEKALAAIRLLEGLLTANVSEDQKGVVQGNPLYAEAKSRLQEFLLSGGGGLLEVQEVEASRTRILARSIVYAIRKYSTEDDLYRPMELEKYPVFVQRVFLALFPVLARLRPQMPPYGIEEGEEITYSSRRMELPLSQAILYLESELLPELEKRLEQEPGDPRLQQEIRGIHERIEDYRKLRFFPRSIPVLLEKGYYTEGMTSFSADGEMLVPIPLPVTFKSGTNLDRKMELVRMDLVKRIAGRGISPAIDADYRHLKSLASGTRGSSRNASMRLNPRRGFAILKQEFPFLARLEDKEKFLELAVIVRTGSISKLEKSVTALIEQEGRASATAAGLIGISGTFPS